MLASLTDLAARLPFVMDEDEEREAEGALSDLSVDAQSIGSAGWTLPANTPQAVKNLILRAAARHMKNYEGYIASRAGDEAVQWAEQDVAGQATFTDDEKKMLRQMGGRLPFIGGVSVVGYGTANRSRYPTGYVAVTNGSPFPMYADGAEPW